jgi:hypothetical protein
MHSDIAPEPDNHPDTEAGDRSTAPAIGDRRVDDALGRLDDLDGADVCAHVDIYDEVHRSLAAVLDDPAAVPEQ